MLEALADDRLGNHGDIIKDRQRPLRSHMQGRGFLLWFIKHQFLYAQHKGRRDPQDVCIA